MDIQSIAFEQVTHEYSGDIVALHDLTLAIEPGVFGPCWVPMAQERPP